MRRLALALALTLAYAPAAFADAQLSGTITTNGDIVRIKSAGTATGAVQISGSWTGTVQFEATLDDTNFVSVSVMPMPTGAAVTSATANGMWIVAGPFTSVRVRASASMTGTATVTMLFTTAQMPFIGGPIASPLRVPAGSAAAPSILFGNDTNTGLYQAAANMLSFSQTGTEYFRIQSGANTMYQPMVMGTGSLGAMSVGTLGVSKITASGTAVGAAGGKIEWVCGTNAGTLKQIIYAGTSTTPVTTTDNIGTGVTGC